MLLKRGGRGHDVEGVEGTKPGPASSVIFPAPSGEIIVTSNGKMRMGPSQLINITIPLQGMGPA